MASRPGQRLSGIGYLLFRFNRIRFLPLGLGIVSWGLMNAVNHLVCSVIFLEYEPGIITGILWIPLAITALNTLNATEQVSIKLIVGSFVVAVVFYWTLPILLFINVDKIIGVVMF